MHLPTLYKARDVPTKRPVCAICVERTRGKTLQVAFGYGVAVWLCEGHASADFLTRRGGRDLVLTLTELWRANGCLTAARHKAMQAHLSEQRARPVHPRPGSYAWPMLRLRAEQLFAAGASLGHVQHKILAAPYVNADPPSARTIQRWHAERRWVRPTSRAG
jgi:hypothetical protein